LHLCFAGFSTAVLLRHDPACSATMPRLSQFAIFLAATILLALPGCFLSILVYLTCMPGHDNDTFGSVLLAAQWTPGVALRVLPVIGVLAVISSLCWFSHTKRPLVVILAGAAGVMTAPLTTLHSPHVSLALAALCMGFVWMTISAVALLACGLGK